MKYNTSKDLFAEAGTLMPGGVSSPVRAIKPYPFYTAYASGAHLTTVDGAVLIDCCQAYGPLILGHAPQPIRRAITEQLDFGWLYGTPTPLEPACAKLITQDHPGMDMVRFVSSGSEATMAAIRVARGYTGRKDIIKIEGGFHGAHDAVLVKAGSGATTMGVPGSAGVLAIPGRCPTIIPRRFNPSLPPTMMSQPSSLNRCSAISARFFLKRTTSKRSAKLPRHTTYS